MFQDDYMFPTTVSGMKKAGMVFESACTGGDCKKKDQDGESGEAGVNESANENIFESVLEAAAYDMSESSIRSQAMSAVLGWLEAGDYSYEELDSAIVAVADLNGDDEIGPDEEDYYSDLWELAADALATLGADVKDVQIFYEGPGEEADKAGVRMGTDLSAKLNEVTETDDEIVTAFSMGYEPDVLESAGEGYNGVYEGVFKWMKRMVGGVVKRVHKRVSGKARKMSAAAKAALKKARRKALSSAAIKKRVKSLKKGIKRGLYKLGFGKKK